MSFAGPTNWKPPDPYIGCWTTIEHDDNQLVGNHPGNTADYIVLAFAIGLPSCLASSEEDYH